MRLIGSLLATLLLAGCATTPKEPVNAYQLIVRIEGRAGVVLIESGPRGVVYTVKNREREVVESRETLAELKEHDPAMGEQMDRAVVWAGL